MVLRFLLITLLLLFPKVALANYAIFNGTTTFATVPNKSDMVNDPLIFYIEVKPTALSSSLGHNQCLFTKLNTAGATYELCIESADDKFHFRTNVGGAGGVNIVDDTAITANTHYHVSVHINGSLGVTMYVNSTTAEASTGTSAAFDVTGAGDLKLGGRASADRNFQGEYYMFRMWNLETASISVPALMSGFGQASGKIHEIGFFDGEGTGLYNTGTEDSDGTVSDVEWIVRQYSYVIPEEDNYKYPPIEMTGTMWENMGISRETEPLESGDWSWTYNTKCDLPQYNKIWLSPTGNDVTGNGTEGNPYATFAPLFNQFTGVAEYGDCAVLKPGTYYLGSVTVYLHGDTSTAGNNKKFIITGSGEGEAIVRFDYTDDLNWTAYNADIQVTDWFENMNIGSQPTNVVLDDNWPYGTRRVWAFEDIERDGDWFFDNKQTGTTTSTTSGKLIDSNADFGNEDRPTRVGQIIAVPSISPTFKTEITAIDSATQLSVNDTVASGNTYEVWKDLYVHTSGDDPWDDRQIIVPRSFYAADDFGFNVQGQPYIEITGITMIGAGTYSVGGFTTDYTPHIDIYNVVSKYSGKGTSAVGKYSDLHHIISFGQGISGHGNGTWGAGVGGTNGGWPSVCGCRTGCIVAWSFGEGIGGQANPTSNYGDGRIVENSIIVNAWSVNLYPVDTVFGATLRNNVIFNREFRPRWILPDSELADREMERSRIWRRQFPQGFLYGDEVAAAGQTEGRLGYLNIHDNIFFNTRGCHDVFKEIPIPLGFNHIDFVHNVCVSPVWDGVLIGSGWAMIEADKIAGGDLNDSSRIYNNIFLGLNAAAFYNMFNNNETNTDISGLHSDYNYFFFQNPRSFAWKLATQSSFSAYQSASGQDAHSTLGTVDDEDVISPAILGRSDWGADEIQYTIDDFTPSVGSALINTGTLLLNEGGTRDHDFQLDRGKKFRPLGSAPDIGAIEVGEWYPRQHKNGAISGGSF